MQLLLMMAQHRQPNPAGPVASRARVDQLKAIRQSFLRDISGDHFLPLPSEGQPPYYRLRPLLTFKHHVDDLLYLAEIFRYLTPSEAEMRRAALRKLRDYAIYAHALTQVIERYQVALAGQRMTMADAVFLEHPRLAEHDTARTRTILTKWIMLLLGSGMEM